METFIVKIKNHEDYLAIKNIAEKLDYSLKTFEDTKEWIGNEKFVKFEGYKYWADYNILPSSYSRTFYWQSQSLDVIDFMKKQNNLSQAVNKEKTFQNKYIYNLEERVHQLEQSLKSERKNTQRIDRKLRHRIQMLESQVDMMENNNPNFVKCKLETYEGLPLNDDAFHEERYLFDKLVFKKTDMEMPKEGAFYSPQKLQDKAIKVAILIENEEEFNELMDIYQTRSYKRTNLYASQHKGYYKNFSRFKENGVLYISMENNFSIWDEEHSPISLAYQIIPFKTLKAILG